MGLPKNKTISLRRKYRSGKNNLISDVEGVKVGHCTLRVPEKGIHTGVTAVIPHDGNTFKEKLIANVSIINGFGKSAGLIQIEELGTLETPILLTNTLSVGTAVNALTKYMLGQNEDIGVDTGTVNCVVTECNDGRLNDIRGMHITEEMVFEALASTDVLFEEGAVGSGTGMICMGLKGGIGSASRIICSQEQDFTIGTLVMSNFGQLDNLRIDGKLIIKEQSEKFQAKDKGSIIIIIATDIPLSSRQLMRLAKRSMSSLGRVGSYSGNGSGDIALAFSTANKIPHYSEDEILDIKVFHDDAIDKVFEAGCEAVEEAIVSSLYHGKTTVGIRNNKVYGLLDYIKENKEEKESEKNIYKC